jgi:hypothetical protein
MKTFGPIVWIDDRTQKMEVKCITRTHWCLFYTAGQCSHVRPNQAVPDPSSTPDFCTMKAGAISDAEEMIDFDRMGLTGMPRPWLQREAKRLGAQCPRPISKASAQQLRKAIRQANLSAASQSAQVSAP